MTIPVVVKFIQQINIYADEIKKNFVKRERTLQEKLTRLEGRKMSHVCFVMHIYEVSMKRQLYNALLVQLHIHVVKYTCIET